MIFDSQDNWISISGKIILIAIAPSFLMLVIFVALTPFMLLEELMYPSPVYELSKDKFVCTREHTVKKGLSTQSVCDRYEMKGHINE